MTTPDAVPAVLDDREDRVDEALRGKLLGLLAEAGRHQPYMRFGQLVSMLTAVAETATPYSIYDVEDDELTRAVEEYLSRRPAD